MTENLEERFWSRIWRCAHKPPCKKCCWPMLTDDGFYSRGARSFIVGCIVDFPLIPAPRAAVIFSLGGQLPLPWNGAIYWCHQCDWNLCCNPSHVRPGSPSDNCRDRRGKPSNKEKIGAWRAVLLPDGRELTWQNNPLKGPSCFYDRKQKLFVRQD